MKAKEHPQIFKFAKEKVLILLEKISFIRIRGIKETEAHGIHKTQSSAQSKVRKDFRTMGRTQNISG